MKNINLHKLSRQCQSLVIDGDVQVTRTSLKSTIINYNLTSDNKRRIRYSFIFGDFEGEPQNPVPMKKNNNK